MSKKVRTRFAPSPTGYLHVGGARTALFNFLYAKSQGGDFIIRVEDTDQERSTEGSEQIILDSMEWLGIKSDEGPREGGPHAPYRQSERLDTFNQYKDQLLENGKAYKCFCSDTELSSKQEQAKKMGLPYLYDGKCRGLTDTEVDKGIKDGEKFTVRFKVDAREIIVQDKVQGKVKFDSRLIGDFIIIKSNGFPSYNYAVVIDDHAMEISHIIRGVGHLSNTPRQIMIHEALGFELPVYAHISEIVGTDKKKLSKRRGATSVLLFKKLGYLPEAFVNYMSLLGWYPRDGVEYMPSGEINAKFDLAHCSRAPAMFDFFDTVRAEKDEVDVSELSLEKISKYINPRSKLQWFNNRYIRDRDIDDLWSLALEFLQADDFIAALIKKDEAQVKKSVESVRVYINSIPDLIPFLHELFQEIDSIKNPEALELVQSDAGKTVVQAFTGELELKKPARPEEFSAAMKAAGASAGVKGRGLFMPIRIASTARMQGLELPQLFSILGWQAVVERILKLTKN